MNRSLAFALLALTVLVIVVLQFVGDSENGGESVPEESALVPGLAGQVNDVTAVDIVAPGGVTVSLRRDESHWRVSQKDEYRADFAQVAELLRELSAATLATAKTARPDWYARLGVSAMSDPEATGRQLEFPARDLPAVIIGQVDPTESGSYARRVDEQRSWLLDRVIEAAVDPVAWLDRAIMDIPSGEIDEVLVRRSDGQTIRIQRAADDVSPEFVLRDVPEGRQAGPAWRRTTLANGLAALNLEDVHSFDGTLPEETSRVLFVTTDGLNFILELFERDNRYWMHISVSAETTASEADAPDAEADVAPVAEASGTETAENEAQSQNSAAERMANAVAADARLSPWLFAITERRFNDLTRALEEYLAPLPEEESVEAID